MTYEFFYKHASPYLNDHALNSLWKIDQLLGGIIARQPETPEFAARTEYAAKMLAERHPERARTAAPTVDATAEIATLERMLGEAAAEAKEATPLDRPSLALDKPMIALYFDAAREETGEAITVICRNPGDGHTTAFHLSGEAAPEFANAMAGLIRSWMQNPSAAKGIHPAHADTLSV